MKVVTWNMGCGPRQSGYRKHHDEAWQYLLEQLKPDVAFVQETLLSRLDKVHSTHAVRVCQLPAHSDSGTAILTRIDLSATDGPSVSISDETYAATARLKTPAGPLDLISLHVYPGKKQFEDLERIVGLAGGFDTPTLVGGDLNSQRKYGPRHAKFFGALEATGMHDAYFGKHGEEGWSFWGKQAKNKYQDDHFFVSESWAPRVRSCEIINEGIVRTVSDHGPVVLEMDLERGQP